MAPFPHGRKAPGLSHCSHVRADGQRRPRWARSAAVLQHSLWAASATRVPVPGSSRPPCSHARASGLGAAFGCGSATLGARRLGFPGHRPVGNHGAGGVTVTTRVCSGFASMAEVGAQCPVSEEKARSWPCSLRGRLAERPLGQSAKRHGGSRGHTREQERFRALLGGGRHSSFARSCSPFTRWVGNAAWALGDGLSLKSRPHGESGAPETRWAHAPPVENIGEARAPRVEAGEAA
jgi:hypothetical protein